MTLWKRPYVPVAVVVLAGLGALFIPRGSSPPALAGDVLPARPAPQFRLTDQFGHSVSLHQFHGRPVVLTFLQAHCTGLCPVITETLRRTLDELGPQARRVAVLAVSADPEGDTRSAVLSFSRQHGVLHRWHYLSGPRTSLAPVWHAYHVYVAPANAPNKLKNGHTGAVYVLDGQGRERVLMVGSPSSSTLARDLRILLGAPPDSAEEAAVPAPEVGHPAPALALRTVTGSTVDLHTIHRPVLLNFWATWCVACKSEIPMLSAWYRAHHSRVLVVGVDQQEPKGPVASYARRYRVRYPVALDANGDVSARYSVVYLPTSLLVNREGVVVAVHVGALTPDYLSRMTARLAPGKS